MARFGWHPEARLIGPDRDVTEPVSVAEGGLLGLPETDAPVALAQAMGAAAVGRAFCVHPEGVDVGGEAATDTFHCMTGGTSGAPRRVVRTQASWLASHAVNADLFGIGPGDSYATLGALSHSLTLYAAVEALCLGADLHLLGGLRPDRQAARLAEGVNVLYATPTQLRQVLRGGPVLPGLRLLLIGGGALDAATRSTVKAACPAARLHVFYGASEASFIALSDEGTPEGSVGRPYPGVEVDIRDCSGGKVASGAVGDILVRSPYLFCGYAGTEGDAVWAEGWLRLGETGWRDAAGALFVAGRRSRMFTVADRNLYPEEMEAFLLGCPGVEQAAVLPLADVRRGHVPVALVKGACRGEALLAACRARFGTEAAPRRVVLVADWPALPSGKTDLRRLEALL